MKKDTEAFCCTDWFQKVIRQIGLLSPDFADEGADCKGCHIRRYHGGAHGGAGQNGDDDPQESTADADHRGADCHREKGTEDSINVLKQAGFENIKKISYDNMRHEILNEADRELVYKDVVDFYKN